MSRKGVCTRIPPSRGWVSRLEFGSKEPRRATEGGGAEERPKPHTVPEQTETGRQSGYFSPGLELEVPADGRDWMALGLGSAGRRPGLGLAWNWICC